MNNKILLPTSEPDVSDVRPWQRPSRLAIAAALATVIAAFALWPNAGDERPPDQLPVPEPFSPPIGEWAETSFAGLDGSFTAIAESEQTLVAVGTGLRVDSPPFVFWSADGDVWESAAGPWEPGDLILDVTRLDTGFVAIGHGIDPDTLGGTGHRFWASTNGRSWRRLGTSGFDGSSVVTQLAHADGRLVAIGYEGQATVDPGFRDSAREPGRVWTSIDGSEWNDVTPSGSDPWFSSLTVTGDGGFLVGGRSMQQPTVWRLEDDWTETRNTQEEYRNIAATSVVEAGDGLVVMAQAISPESMVFMWSVDAEGTWRGLFGETRRPQSTGWMTAIDGDLYAGPPFSRAVFTTGPELWVSDRGTDWFGVEVTRGVSPWPPAAVSTATEHDGRVLAFGSRGGVPTVWSLGD